MFSALRNITIILCSLIFVLMLMVGMYFKHSFVDGTITGITEEKAMSVGDTYTRSIWNKYYPVIAFLSDKPINEWSAFPPYTILLNDSESIFKSPGMLKAVVYNSNSQVVFDSASQTQITPKSSLTMQSVDAGTIDGAMNLAMSGKSSSVLVLNAEYKGKGGQQNKSVVKTFVPLRVTEVKKGTEELATKTVGVLAIDYDVTKIVNGLDILQFGVLLIISGALFVLAVIVIITSRKAENEIEKQQEASMEMAAAKATAESESRSKSQFLANVSHELRTPLNAIIGFSEIIESESMGPIGNDQYKEFIKDIHTSGVHLLSLINDILDFSKAEENKLQVDFEQVDLTKLIKVSTRMVMPRAEEAKVALEDDIPDEHFVLVADPKRLKQVLLNLLSNAVKFTPENGTVTVKVWKDLDTSSIQIEIKDTGVGMQPQDLARALAPFGQVDNKLSRRYEGTGLGLPLTKKLVELMRGKFDMKSEVGLGTTVIINMPLPDDAIESEESTDENREIAEGDSFGGANGAASEEAPVEDDKAKLEVPSASEETPAEENKPETTAPPVEPTPGPTAEPEKQESTPQPVEAPAAPEVAAPPSDKEVEQPVAQPEAPVAQPEVEAAPASEESGLLLKDSASEPVETPATPEVPVVETPAEESSGLSLKPAAEEEKPQEPDPTPEAPAAADEPSGLSLKPEGEEEKPKDQ